MPLWHGRSLRRAFHSGAAAASCTWRRGAEGSVQLLDKIQFVNVAEDASQHCSGLTLPASKGVLRQAKRSSSIQLMSLRHGRSWRRQTVASDGPLAASCTAASSSKFGCYGEGGAGDDTGEA